MSVKRIAALSAALFICVAISALPVGRSSITVGADFSGQSIMYTKHYVNRSTIGPGVSLGYMYRTDPVFSIGGSVNGGYFGYEDFHSYWDLRVLPEVKMHFLNLENSSGGYFFLAAVFGIGPAIAIRDDSATGVYGVVKASLAAGYGFPNDMAVELDFDFSASFQSDESTVGTMGAKVLMSIPVGRKK